jgi:hypothetical protein
VRLAKWSIIADMGYPFKALIILRATSPISPMTIQAQIVVGIRIIGFKKYSSLSITLSLQSELHCGQGIA